MSVEQITSPPASVAAASRRPGIPHRITSRAGFWAVAAAFAAVTAFSTTPSGLYGIYEHRLGLSLTTVTIVYAVYAVGTVASLVLAGHVSDWYGRRAVLSRRC